MADDDYLPAHLYEFYAQAAAVHGPNLNEVLRQYQAMAEVCPLVVKDLEISCYGRESTAQPGDPFETHKREGMRIVWMKVRALSELDDFTIEQLELRYARGNHGRRQDGKRRRTEAGHGRSGGRSGSGSKASEGG